MDTQQPSRIPPLLVRDTHGEFILNNVCIYPLTDTEGVKLPNAPAANTRETDERHSQEARAKDVAFKLHPLTSSFTRFPQLIHARAATSSADTPRLLPEKAGSAAAAELRPSSARQHSSAPTPPSLCDQCSPPTWTYIKVALFPSPSTTSVTPPPIPLC